MTKPAILVVDDDVDFSDSVKTILLRKEYDVSTVLRADTALEEYENDFDRFDLILCDMKMPGLSGLDFLQKVREKNPDVPFIFITAYGDIESAVEAMKYGAQDFIEKKGKMISIIEQKVQHYMRYTSLVTENRHLRSALRKRWDYVGATPAMKRIKELVAQIAESKSTALICGESGTGKELVARSIHYLSPRKNEPFIKINCAALPENLIESELFGHEKGAFTGAVKTKLGKFELASGGTLLLDEIAEMPASVQAKLLRALQEKEINRVGSERTITVDVRVIATTNRDIKQDVRDGRFREDLYYRLNVFCLMIPPLRERKDDIPQLVVHFIEKYNDENGFAVTGITDGALGALRSYDWPGNIRELENTVERAVVLTRNGDIDTRALDIEMYNASAAVSRQPAEALTPGISIADAEKQLIFSTLAHCDNNRTKAARMLDISVRTLRNKLNEYAQQD